MIHVIDYGMGNLRSVEKGFQHVGADVKICTQPEQLAEAEKLVLPGVGAFRDAMAHLKEQQFIPAIMDHVSNDRPFLGICLGQQLLFDISYEDGEYQGLGILPGEVVRFEEQPDLKIPHMGWNQLTDRQEDNPLFAEIPESAHFYFVHSFHVVPKEESVVASRTIHGSPVVATIRRGNLFATQFHPEKSQKYGLQILKNFAQL